MLKMRSVFRVRHIDLNKSPFAGKFAQISETRPRALPIRHIVRVGSFPARPRSCDRARIFKRDSDQVDRLVVWHMTMCKRSHDRAVKAAGK